MHQLTFTDPSLPVRDARNRFLAVNGFDVLEYSKIWRTVFVAGTPIVFPNPDERRMTQPAHDLHHVVTGFGTDVLGEAELAAWELRTGALSRWRFRRNRRKLLRGGVLNPRRVLRAFFVAGGQRNLFGEPDAYERLLQMTVGELRVRMGLPVDGLACMPPRLHAYAPLSNEEPLHRRHPLDGKLDLPHSSDDRMFSLAEIDVLERRYAGPHGAPSLGKAYAMLKQRWGAGARDRETALRLLFLAWYAFAEPTPFTGLPYAEDTGILFREVFEELGGEASSDAEFLFAVGVMMAVAAYGVGHEAEWAAIGERCAERARLLRPDGFHPEHFLGQGAYGDYMAHQAEAHASWGD